ncbi:hypothetical protein BOX15_Mlig021474g1, partial [Macrostomum lignano]
SQRMDRPSSATDDLEDELLCPVCLDLYTDPVVLPCSHSLCRECLRRTLSAVGRRCPQCRRDLPFGVGADLDGAVAALPRNLALAAFVARFRDEQQRKSRAKERQLKQAELEQKRQVLLQKKSRQDEDESGGLSCELCRGESEHRPAELYCPQCEVAYCTDCLRRYHPSLGPLRRHAVVQLAGDADVLRRLRRSLRYRRGQQQPPQPLPPSSANGETSRSRQSQRGVGAGGSLPLCPRHPANQIRLHCATCDVGVCTDCLAVDDDSPESTSASMSRSAPSTSTPAGRHAGHSLITLTAAAEARRAKCRQLGEKAAALALEVDREATSTRRARDRLRSTIVEARRSLELQSRRAALDLAAAVRAVRADAEYRAAALEDAAEAAARLERQLAAQSRLSSRLTRVSRQLLQSSTSPPSSAGTSLATDAATDQTDLQESAYLAGLRQFDRCSDKASSLADSGAALRLGLESRAAEAKQLPAEFNDRLRRHLAEVWLLAAPLRAGQAADEERSCRPPGTAGSIPESRPDTASTTHSNGGGTGKPSAAQALFPREASTWGFSTAVFSPDCPVSNGTSWTILIGWGQHQHLHQQQPQWSDILASTGVSERPILSAGNFNSNSSSSLAQKQQQQQRLLLGDCGFGLIVTERCVAFIARGGELAQRPVCRLPLSPASSSSSSSNGSVSLRVCIRLSLPPHGPAALAYEISEQQQQQQDSSSSSSNASLSGVELLGTRCSSLYPVLCVTSRVRVQVLEQPAAALVAR